MSRTLLPGKPYPLGANVYRRGTNFSIFSENATRVDICFFDPDGTQTDCFTLRERTAFSWHGFVNEIKAGQLYGYRVDGAWEPEHGLRFNFNKLLVDPYAKAISGDVDWKQPIFGYDVASGDTTKMSTEDDTAGVPKSVLIDTRLYLGEDIKPATPPPDSPLSAKHLPGSTP